MMNVLVVEDDESIQKTLGWILESLGHFALLAGSGEEALTLVLPPEQGKVGLLLVDLSLPGINGEEFVTRWLEAQGDAAASLPDVLFCSALQEGELRVAAARLNSRFPDEKIHFLRKPFRVEELERFLSVIESRAASRLERAA